MNSNIIITVELFKKGGYQPQGTVLDINNIDNCIKYLKTLNKNNIFIYDATRMIQFKQNELIFVNDHVNCSGTNPLIGQQEKLNIDFIDMTRVYKQERKGIITHGCGKKLITSFKFPSHFLVHIVILAQALGFKNISGILINKLNKNE